MELIKTEIIIIFASFMRHLIKDNYGWLEN